MPFKDLLFPDQEFSESEVPAISRKKREVGAESNSRRQMETTDSVQWKGNGGIAHKVGPLKPLNADDEDVRERKKSAKKKATTKATKPTAVKKKKNPSKPRIIIVHWRFWSLQFALEDLEIVLRKFWVLQISSGVDLPARKIISLEEAFIVIS